MFFTFDDGGVSFYRPIADLLEQQGYRGHFFITTARIGTTGFLTKVQIRELHLRGHVIGSHSATHPTRMATLTADQLREEWTTSVNALQDIVGEPLPVASVPGGYYSRMVAETARDAGIRVLFNSEPTASVGSVDDCLVIGRYVIRRGNNPELSAGFAAGRFLPRFQQSLEWKAKGIAKSVGGTAYLKLRRTLFGDQRLP